MNSLPVSTQQFLARTRLQCRDARQPRLNLIVKMQQTLRQQEKTLFETTGLQLGAASARKRLHLRDNPLF
jgi:hypothetical protein